MTDHDPYAPWASPSAPLHPYGPQPAYPQPPVEVRVGAPAPVGRGLAVTGVVLGGIALLGVLLLGVFALVTTFFGPIDDGGGGSYEPTRGTIAPTQGGALAGPALAAEIERQVRDEGGDPEGVTCPATPRLAQDVTTVCHGAVDGDAYAFVVFFESAAGDYTLLEV